jgi:hypothetical protein
MAASDAQAFPVKNTAQRFYGVIRSATTGNPITGGLTALALTISKDGAAFVAGANAPVEIGTTGYFYVDLTAAEANYSADVLQVTASNSGAVYWSKEVVFSTSTIANSVWSTTLPSDVAGYPTTYGAAVKRTLSWNENNYVNTGTMFYLYDRTGTSTVIATQYMSPNSTGGERGQTT